MCSSANNGGAGARQPAMIVGWPLHRSTIAEELIQYAGPAA